MIIAIAFVIGFVLGRLSAEYRYRRATRIVLDDGDQPAGDNVMGTPLNNQFSRQIDLEFVDDEGRDEPVQAGTVTGECADPTVATVTIDPTEKFATITPVVKGVSTSGVDGAGVPVELGFTFHADANRDPGITTVISGSYSCAIVGKDATSIKVSEGGDTPLP